jgi:hypothetical protein
MRIIQEDRQSPERSNIAKAMLFLGVDLRGVSVLDLGPGMGLDLDAARSLGARETRYVENHCWLPPTKILLGPPHVGILGDFYEPSVLRGVLPVDIVWSYSSITIYLWNTRKDWLDCLCTGASVVVLTPYWSYDKVGRLSSTLVPGKRMEDELTHAGFSRVRIENIVVEPQCPHTYVWRRK